jgi:hypothetical protein
MIKRITHGVAAAALLLTPVAVRAADTFSGEVIDLACYLSHPATGRGPGHRKCAETCAKKGIPMGLLTDDKQVLLLLEDHDAPKGYADAIGKAAETITVEGAKVTQGGMTGIVVQAVK